VADTGFAAVPDGRRFVLANARLPAALVTGVPATAGTADGDILSADIVVADGRIETVTAPGASTEMPRVDLDGGMAWPCFADIHTHIDKGHIWPRRSNPDGTFAAAIEAVAVDRERNWTAADVRRRMDFSLRAAYAHGTALIRTHIDSIPPQHAISWPVFAEIRRQWAGRVALQAVATFPVDDILDDGFCAEIAGTLRHHGGVLGAVTYMVAELDRALDRVFRLATDNGFDLDFHVDESQDPAARSLRHIAKAALRHKFGGRVLVGHCCSLAVQPDDEAAETMAMVRDAGLSVVSLPMCNAYLQDRRAGCTPRRRGVTLLHEMKALGIPVAVASDNIRDPFYAYGDLDPLEVYREAVRLIHLDHPIGDWPAAIARDAAAIVGRPDIGTIAAGCPADLVLFRARNWTELLSRPQTDRTVLRAGAPIARTLPDYRELDDLAGMQP
jgi:cytosine deaminase